LRPKALQSFLPCGLKPRNSPYILLPYSLLARTPYTFYSPAVSSRRSYFANGENLNISGWLSSFACSLINFICLPGNACYLYLSRHDHETFFPLPLLASRVSSGCFKVSQGWGALSRAWAMAEPSWAPAGQRRGAARWSLNWLPWARLQLPLLAACCCLYSLNAASKRTGPLLRRFAFPTWLGGLVRRTFAQRMKYPVRPTSPAILHLHSSIFFAWTSPCCFILSAIDSSYPSHDSLETMVASPAQLQPRRPSRRRSPLAAPTRMPQ